MKKIPYTIVITFSLLSVLFLAQFSFSVDNTTPHFIKQIIPDNFPAPVYNFNNNRLTKEGFELGRRLFYDGRLSQDGLMACGSCHQQFAAFADFEHVFSHGVNNKLTLRNAPPLFNLAWHKDFHLDGGINHIETQPLSPLTGEREMNNRIDTVIARLKKDETYRRMFKAAFGTAEINSQRMLKALAQFTGNIVSADSKFDRMKKGEAVFNEWEKNGYVLFQQRCADCHPEPLFTDLKYHNIGLPLDTFLYDYGRIKITGEKSDSLKFKTPSLRNITRTDPYMHDGRYWGLSTALNHWKTRAAADSTADSLIVYGRPLDQREVSYMVSFLHTLLDTSLLKNKSLADPIPGNNIHR